jgi:hypothetical protein
VALKEVSDRQGLKTKLYIYILSQAKQLDLKFQFDKQLSITGGCAGSYIKEKRTESGAG